MIQKMSRKVKKQKYKLSNSLLKMHKLTNKTNKSNRNGNLGIQTALKQDILKQNRTCKF